MLHTKGVMFMSIARRLKTTHFRLILRIAETGTLQSAAVVVAISQPAASRMLAEIETLVGAPLFTRHAKGMVLTAIGETILRHARQILLGFDRLETDVQQISNGRTGSVRIGTVTGPAVGMIVPVIRAVRKLAPEVEFNVEVAPSATLMRGLEEGSFDFIIARPPPDYNSRNYGIYPARNEVVSMLVCRDHPMAGRKAVRLRELTQFEWVIQDRGTGRSKGFGFVEMNSDEEAASAIEGLNEQEHDGRTLKVNEARPREPRGRSNYGGGGGGQY